MQGVVTLSGLSVCLHWHLNWASRLNTAEPFKRVHMGKMIPSTGSGPPKETFNSCERAASIAAKRHTESGEHEVRRGHRASSFLSVPVFFFFFFLHVLQGKDGTRRLCGGCSAFFPSFFQRITRRKSCQFEAGLENLQHAPNISQTVCPLVVQANVKKSLFLTDVSVSITDVERARQCSRQELNKPITQPEAKRWPCRSVSL